VDEMDEVGGRARVLAEGDVGAEAEVVSLLGVLVRAVGREHLLEKRGELGGGANGSASRTGTRGVQHKGTEPQPHRHLVKWVA